MVLLAKNEPGGAEGLVWETAGEEGAIEVHPRLAHSLLAIPGEHFFIVAEKAVKKVEKAVEAVVADVEKVLPKKASTKAAAKEEVAPAADVVEALEAASPTKRRSTKE
jgi:hypothetical protein